MSKLSMLLLGSLACAGMFSYSATAENVKVDLSEKEALGKFGIYTIADLGLGEKATISSFGSMLCENNAELNILTSTRLTSKISKYSNYLTITKLKGSSLKIEHSDKGAVWDKEAYKDFLLRIAGAPNCDLIKNQRPDMKLNSIQSLFGKKSIRELIEDNLAGNVIKSESKITNNLSNGSLKSNWNIIEDVSPIDDSKSVTLYNKSSPELLYLRCKESKLNVYVSTEEYLARNNKVTLRFGSESPYESEMSLSTDKKALFFNNSISTIKKLASVEQFIIRYTPYNSGSITAIFKTDGLSAYLDKLKSACPNLT